jgi:ribosomal protein L13
MNSGFESLTALYLLVLPPPGNPEFIIYNSVKGMLPHNSLGSKLIKHLKVYVGENHPHNAQNPKSNTLCV